MAPAISKFHAILLRFRRRGYFELKDIANMEQTPLPFVLDDCTSFDMFPHDDRTSLHMFFLIESEDEEVK